MKYTLTYDAGSRLMIVKKQNVLFLSNKLTNTMLYVYGTITNKDGQKLLRYVVVTLFFYYKEKIVDNYFKKNIELIRNSFFSMTYYLQVEDDIYKIKTALLPHFKNCCKIFKNDKLIANVDKKHKEFPPHKYEINFYISNTNDHLFGLIHLLITLTLVDEL